MKIILNLLFVAVLLNLFAISSCTEDEVNLPPGKVTLTSPTNNSTGVASNAELTWQAATDPDGDAVLYDVYLGVDANPSTAVISNQTGTTYSPSLTANTTYYWKVVAKDPNGGTSQSNVWSFSTLNNGPETITLTTPANEATSIALDATLTWEPVADPDGDAVTYDVYFGTDATPVTVKSADQTGTSYTPTLEGYTTYFWKVIAKDDKGGVSESAIWSFTTLNNAPGSVTLTAPADAASNVALDASLTWDAATDPDGDDVIYDVYFGTEATPVTVVSTDHTGTAFAPAISGNATYYWKIVAKDDKGASSESEIWSFSTLNSAPALVTLISPEDNASDVALDATLNWEASVDPEGDAVVYDVYFGTETTPVTAVSIDQSGTTFVPALEIGATYHWKVVAKDPYGGISESAVWSFTVRIQIGDFYQGGVVFYLDETGKHGLVCPITNQSPASPEVHKGWGCSEVPGADGTAIGTGLQNTLDIIAACPTIGIAAEICASLKLNGYEDWYLPSIDELKAMNQQRNIITEYALTNGGEDFVAHYYYSSSESTNFYAFAYGFATQQQVFQVGKLNLNYPFRAVRAF